MGKLKWAFRGLLSALAVAVVWSLLTHPWGWLYGIGVHPYPGPQTPWTYQLLSGFVPALTVVGLFSLITGGWHHLNCHEPGCLRLGKHKVNGTAWCNIHHENARPERTENEILTSIEALLKELVECATTASSSPSSSPSP
jgi:hypothetical protein